MKALTPTHLQHLPQLSGLLDSHIHLDSNEYSKDLQECLERAQACGVVGHLLPATSLESARKIVQLCQQYSQLRGAAGIHPHQAESYTPTFLSDMRQLLDSHPFVAIGETGLELFYDFCPLEIQQQSLKAHLELAAESQLPLILHCREAEAALYESLLAWSGRISGVVHCFTGGWEWAQRFLDLGFYLGIGGLVTLPKAQDVHEVAQKVPADRWLLETDGPYLAPIPCRGMRNESCLLPYVVQRLAELRQEDPQQLVDQAHHNTRQLFRLWSQQ